MSHRDSWGCEAGLDSWGCEAIFLLKLAVEINHFVQK